MLRRAFGTVAGIALTLAGVSAPASAAEPATCPTGTNPVSVGSGVICVVVTDPGHEGGPGGPSEGSGNETTSQGCQRSDGTQVPCQTDDGYWWAGSQCYAAPFDAAPGDPAWQGHTDGTLWACTRCATSAESAETCNVQIIWLPPGAQPGPPTPDQLAQTALGQLPLAKADLHMAPEAPEPSYVRVENWLWIPESQWSVLTKSVSAGGTTVTVIAEPSAVVWSAGPKVVTCPGPGRPWAKGMSDAATTTCGVTFDRASSREQGGVFRLAAVIRYGVTWTCTGACTTASGDLGSVDSPASIGQIRVLQRQTVVVG